VTLPAAGWFQDPQNASRLRWWDGRTWGGSTQPAPAAARTDTDVVDKADPQFSVDVVEQPEHEWACGAGAATEVRRLCLFGWGAMALALVSMIVNPAGILSVIAIAFAVVGFVQPRGTGAWRTVGRSIALSAFVLSVATLLVALAMWMPVPHLGRPPF